MAATLLAWLFGNALVALPLALLAAIAGRLLRSRPALVHPLWLLVLAALLMPPLPLPSCATAGLRQAARGWISPASAPIAAEAGIDATRVTRVTRVAPPEQAAQQTAAMRTVRPSPEPAAALPPAALRVGTRDPAPHPTPAAPPTPFTRDRMATALLAVWALGSLTALVLLIRRMRAAARLMVRSRPAPDALVDAVAAVAQRMATTPPPVRIVAGLGSPGITAFGRTTLLWPSEVEADVAMIAHELAHVIRRDVWATWLSIAGTLCQWWNPLLWIARRQAHDLAELCCDGWATTTFPGHRRRYAEALLRTVERFVGDPAPLTTVALGGNRTDRRALERRLHMVMKCRTSPKTSAALALAALVCAGLAAPSWSGVTLAQEPAPGAAVDPLVDRRAEADRLFEQGRYAEAAALYRALMDDAPASDRPAALFTTPRSGAVRAVRSVDAVIAPTTRAPAAAATTVSSGPVRRASNRAVALPRADFAPATAECCDAAAPTPDSCCATTGDCASVATLAPARPSNPLACVPIDAICTAPVAAGDAVAVCAAFPTAASTTVALAEPMQIDTGAIARLPADSEPIAATAPRSPTPPAYPAAVARTSTALLDTVADDALWQRALDAYQHALDLDPTNRDALLGSAELLIRAGRVDEGLALIRQALDTAPRVDRPVRAAR